MLRAEALSKLLGKFHRMIVCRLWLCGYFDSDCIREEVWICHLCAAPRNLPSGHLQPNFKLPRQSPGFDRAVIPYSGRYGLASSKALPQDLCVDMTTLAGGGHHNVVVSNYLYRPRRCFDVL